MKKLLFSLYRVLPLLCASVALYLWCAPASRALDLADAPSTAQDPAADLGDAYFFLDPNDNSQAVLALTVRGFLVPGAGVNVASFDPKVRFSFEIENTGDAVADKKLKVFFEAASTPGAPQTAHIKGAGINFVATTTPATLASTANAPTVTSDAASGFQFFAGPVDDPSFADLVAVNRYLDSARSGAANPALLRRGRDTFAGYNTLGIAIRVPVSFLRGASSSVGLHAVSKRRPQTPLKTGGFLAEGSFVNVDRVGVPGVNTFFIPPARQDSYSAAKPVDDAASFAGDFAATLKALGTSDLYASILNSIAVARGNFLRLDTTISNDGAGGGTNAAAGFPNGRRLRDDVVDTLLTIVANGSFLGDSVDAGDVLPVDRFPFFRTAPPTAGGWRDRRDPKLVWFRRGYRVGSAVWAQLVVRCHRPAALTRLVTATGCHR